MTLIRYLRDLQRPAVDIRLDSRHIEHGHGHLGVGWLRPELVVRIPQTLAHSVDTDQGTSAQEVLALQRTSSHRVLLCPDTITVLGQQLGGSQLITRVAASGLLCVAEVCRARRRSGDRIPSVLHCRLAYTARGRVSTRLCGIVGRCGQSRLKSLVTTKHIGL